MLGESSREGQMTSFSEILARAEARKGGPAGLAALLPPAPDREALAALPDDRILSQMSKRVFSAGFVWSVITAKWPAFEEVFLGFDPAALVFQPDDFWEAAGRAPGIVRNGAKILAIRANARFVRDVSAAHGGFGRFLADWPTSDQVGLMKTLADEGSRLGGATGQTFLRFIGWDGFVTSRDVVACLRAAGVDLPPEVKSKRDLMTVQAQFDRWQAETGLCRTHLSRICALSIDAGEGGGEED
jgi:3-methyladenine DNA glycosylase Tag